MDESMRPIALGVLSYLVINGVFVGLVALDSESRFDEELFDYGFWATLAIPGYFAARLSQSRAMINVFAVGGIITLGWLFLTTLFPNPGISLDASSLLTASFRILLPVSLGGILWLLQSRFNTNEL